MKIKHLGIFWCVVFTWFSGIGQVHYSDTIPTGEATTFMYLNVQVPYGSFFMQGSPVCGLSIAQTNDSDSNMLPKVVTRQGPDGLINRTISVARPTQRQTTGTQQVAGNAHFIEDLPALTTSPSGYESFFHLDPTLYTDLYLELGTGQTRLDLSDMTLRKVSINSAFSDVMIIYSKPNQVEMEELQVRAAKANVVVKHPERARAGLVVLQNDMGDTKVILGKAENGPFTMFLKSGVGRCILVIERDQPVKLTMRNGVFASKELGDSFVKIADGKYANAAANAYPDQAVNIICNLDFGSLTIIDN